MAPCPCCDGLQPDPLCTIHGPFGTGKSLLLVAAIHLLLALRGKEGPLKGTRVAVAAHTNAALDRVLLALHASGHTGALFCRHATWLGGWQGSARGAHVPVQSTLQESKVGHLRRVPQAPVSRSATGATLLQQVSTADHARVHAQAAACGEANTAACA